MPAVFHLTRWSCTVSSTHNYYFSTFLFVIHVEKCEEILPEFLALLNYIYGIRFRHSTCFIFSTCGKCRGLLVSCQSKFPHSVIWMCLISTSLLTQPANSAVVWSCHVLSRVAMVPTLTSTTHSDHSSSSRDTSFPVREALQMRMLSSYSQFVLLLSSL